MRSPGVIKYRIMHCIITKCYNGMKGSVLKEKG
jgi:hypothetical protein